MVPSLYELTFTKIICKMPSSGVEISSTQAYDRVNSILKPILDGAGKIVSMAGPEGEVVGAGIEIIGDIMDAADKIADLVVAIETQMRNDGKEPDDFYISLTPDAKHPQPAEDLNNNDGKVVWYPKKGVSPSHGNNRVEMPKNASAPNLPLTVAGTEGCAYCFWDWDNASGDDLLCYFPLDDAHCGTFKKTIYNGLQDCTYYVEYTMKKTFDGI